MDNHTTQPSIHRKAKKAMDFHYPQHKIINTEYQKIHSMMMHRGSNKFNNKIIRFQESYKSQCNKVFHENREVCNNTCDQILKILVYPYPLHNITCSRINIYRIRNKERQIRECSALCLAGTPLDAKALKGERG